MAIKGQLFWGNHGEHLSCTLIFASLLLLSGCASVDNVMRAQPSSIVTNQLTTTPTIVGYKDGIPVLRSQPTKLFGGSLTLYCISEDGKPRKMTEGESLDIPLYVSADISQLLKDASDPKSPILTQREEIAGFLLYLSDRNARIYMSRIFALNKFRKGSIGATRDIATAGAGVSALIVPPVAAGLSAFNLVAGSVSDKIDEMLYSKETVEVLQKGMDVARMQKKAEILDNLRRTRAPDKYRDYNIYQMLQDVDDYDSLASFRRGLEKLKDFADEKQRKLELEKKNASGT